MTARAQRTPTTHRRPPAWKRLIGSEHLAGWAFVTPAVILIAVFALIPIGWSLLLSFQANNLLAPGHYVGFANYKALAKDHAVPLGDRPHARLHGACSCRSRSSARSDLRWR